MVSTKTSKKVRVSASEKKGIKMIQALQKMAGIDESEARALAGWRGLSNSEQEETKIAYQMFNK